MLYRRWILVSQALVERTNRSVLGTRLLLNLWRRYHSDALAESSTFRSYERPVFRRQETARAPKISELDTCWAVEENDRHEDSVSIPLAGMRSPD